MHLNVLNGWQIKKTDLSSPLKSTAISVISILLGLLFSGILLLITGNDPMQIYGQIVQASFGSWGNIGETLVETIPLALCALGVALAFRMQLWNIGAEGQFYMGAIGATYVALFWSHLPIWLLLPLMGLAGILCGGIWCLIPAIPKAFWNVNETISTLLLNYVAISFCAFLVFGPFRDPKGNNFPQSAEFSFSATIPAIGGTRISYALV
jgi:ABC-type uncharacterized transport system permease subunit